MSVFCKVRYGTVLMPFETGMICSKFPGLAPLTIVNPELIGTSTNISDSLQPFDGYKALCERVLPVGVPSKTTGFPSVSIVSSAVSNKQALYQWQKQMIKEHGKSGLSAFVKRRMMSGRLFHKVVELLLSELKSNGKISSNSVDILRKQKNAKEFETELTACIERIGEFLHNLQPHPLMMLEHSAPHPRLCYTGRFDAVVELDGELTLVDWKTINVDSMKSQTAEQKLPADLYDNPIQLAAYVASVNAHPDFEKLPTIKQAAVVLVYEDGRGVEVVKIDSTQIEHYFEEFRRRLNEFWWKVENEKPRAGAIHLTFNPMISKEKKVKANKFAN